MRLKIGIEFNDLHFNNINVCFPENGNPGIGGSEYLFALLGRYLTLFKSEYEIYFFHYNNNTLPNNTTSVFIENHFDLIKKCNDYNIDILIHQVSKDKSWYRFLSQYDIKAISWAHIFLEYDELNSIQNCVNVKRVVFVSKEEYDMYIDDDVITKSTYIYNMINVKKEYQIRAQLFNKNITYVGSLVPAKGFHVLAKCWKEILTRNPDAQLYVIGTGKVYSRNIKLGKYNIAEEEYERQFMKYIIDDAGNILPSVHFLGILGEEKENIFKETAIGIVNPTALTETFCMSAIEMEICGVPIVTRKKWGLLDTVMNRSTGLLFKNEKEFIKYIDLLLNDSDLNNQYSQNAREFVMKSFNAEQIVQNWINTINNVSHNIPPKYHRVSKNYFNDYKYFRIIIRFLRFQLHIRVLPSYVRIKKICSTIIKSKLRR